MTYKVPSPTVEQILVRASQDLSGAELLPCIISPLYRVVKKHSLSGTIEGTGILNSTIVYPVLDPGATVESASVKMYITGRAKYTAAPVAIAGGDTFVAGSKTINVAAFSTSSLKSGDILVADNNGGSYVIDTVNSATSVTFTTEVLYTLPTGRTFNVYREYVDYVSTSFTVNSSSITTTTLSDSNSKPFTSGTATLSYRALRADKTGFYRTSSIDQIKADMEIAKDNLLGFVLGNIMEAASGGKEVLAFITADASVASFNHALDELQIEEKAYLIVPLTTNSTILGNVVSHVNSMSQPDNSRFRVALINTVLPVTSDVITFSV